MLSIAVAVAVVGFAVVVVAVVGLDAAAVGDDGGVAEGYDVLGEVDPCRYPSPQDSQKCRKFQSCRLCSFPRSPAPAALLYAGVDGQVDVAECTVQGHDVHSGGRCVEAAVGDAVVVGVAVAIVALLRLHGLPEKMVAPVPAVPVARADGPVP